MMKIDGDNMKCGAKRYFVELLINGERETVEVIARSPIAARKLIYQQYENEAINIISVQLKK